MCVFHVVSKTSSFKKFLSDNPELPVYQSHEKGDTPQIGHKEKGYEDYGFSCDVSDREWHDVEGQVVDMISFLEVYGSYLETLKKTHHIDDWRFDLPYECRLDETYFTQCDYLPPKLMLLAGSLGIGIELSLYWPSSEEGDDEDEDADDDIDVSADADSDADI